jgi:hypothetical protein
MEKIKQIWEELDWWLNRLLDRLLEVRTSTMAVAMLIIAGTVIGLAVLSWEPSENTEMRTRCGMIIGKGTYGCVLSVEEVEVEKE